jgi:signal transduction histidine kinase
MNQADQDSDQRGEGYQPPKGRAHGPTIHQQVALALASPVVDTMMGLFGSIVAILNEYRQILAVNTTLLRTLGVENPGSLIGLRPGEALNCRYAGDGPDGCGTGETCRSCGAALALAAREVDDKPVEEECVLSVEQSGRPHDIDFRVVALPLTTEDTRLTVLIMEDISADKQRAALERTFFHDVNNIVSSLVGATRLLNVSEQENGDDELIDVIRKSALRLAKEVSMQRELTSTEQGRYAPTVQPCRLGELIDDLQDVFQHHPASAGRTVHWPTGTPETNLMTDHSLLQRVLTNALLNALEATDIGGCVRFQVEPNKDQVHFDIHNDKPIPPEAVGRVFQRYYSTKSGEGRGLGTFAMKLFTERYLGGEVTFATSPQEGTTFHIKIPRRISPSPEPHPV